jgi:hypothetical protein
MKKAYYFSSRQIFIATALIVVAILVVDRFFWNGFGFNKSATDPLNPETQAMMRAHGDMLMSSADKAIAVATAAVAKAPETPSVAAGTDKIAVDTKDAWQPAAKDAPQPTIPLSERISVYRPVQLNPHPTDMPVVGEQVTLPLFNGKKYVAEVQNTAVSANGDYSWRGHLTGLGEGQQDSYPVVMTYGEHSIFATITTPEGAYTLESVDGLGWLYKNPSFPELSAPGTNDFLDVDSTR